MIHIATVHYRDDRWIEIQLRYLARHTAEPFRVYASLDGIGSRHSERFDYAADHTGFAAGERPGSRIERKLNALAGEITREAAPEDLVAFMHGDTLPIVPWVDAARAMVEAHGLAAVRRDENGEPIPHWSFCVTSAGLWTELGASWGRGPTWNAFGREVTDTGAVLMEMLDRERVDWHPILRTNAVDLHPIWFGIYGGLVYHHGAAFRTPMSRFDASGYSHLPIGLRNLAGVRRRIANTRLSRRMYRRVRADEDFYLELTETVSETASA